MISATSSDPPHDGAGRLVALREELFAGLLEEVEGSRYQGGSDFIELPATSEVDRKHFRIYLRQVALEEAADGLVEDGRFSRGSDESPEVAFISALADLIYDVLDSRSHAWDYELQDEGFTPIDPLGDV